MNSYSYLNSSNVCGIYEVDAFGKIVYCGNLGNGHFSKNTDLIGNNFFDIAGFENVEDFRQRVQFFFQNSVPTEVFPFDCRCKESVSYVNVKLTRVSETGSEGRSQFVIIDIRKA